MLSTPPHDIFRRRRRINSAQRGSARPRLLGARASVAGVLGAALLLAGCGAPGTASADSNRLRIAYDTDPQCLDGQQVGFNVSLNVARQITDSLTDQDPTTGKLVPWLAKSWTVSKDSTTFTFHLRQGVKFQDGTDFTSKSVKENFEGIGKLGAKAQLAGVYLAGLQSVTTPNDTTAVVTFKQPNAQFLQATSTMSLGFYSHATLQETPEERCTGKIAGTGPFTVKSYTPNDSVALDRNDSYNWPSSLAKHSGKAHLDGIDISIVPEASVRTGSLSAGEVDVDTQVLPQDEELLERSDFTLATRANPGLVYGLYPNEKSALLSDATIRRGLNAAIDRSELTAVISRHQAQATSLLAKSTPGYVDHSDLLAYDPQKAATLFDEAGWKLNRSTGMREKNGQPLKITVQYWQSAPFLELVAQQLRKSGVTLELKRTTQADIAAARKAGTLDVDFISSTRADPDVVRLVFDANGRNTNNRTPGQIDTDLEASAGLVKPQERYKKLDTAVTELIKDGHGIPLVELSGVMAVAPRVKDFAFEASSRIQLYDTSIDNGSAK